MFNKNKQTPDFVILSIYDAQVGVYRKPMVSESKFDVIRDYERIIQSTPDDILVTNAEHFQLFQIGEFNKSSGKLETYAPQHLANLHEIRHSILAKKNQVGIQST